MSAIAAKLSINPTIANHTNNPIATTVGLQQFHQNGPTAIVTAQAKRKRSKFLDLLLNTNWSKQQNQANHLIKLNKLLLACDGINFHEEKSGQSPLSLAISSKQITSADQQQQQTLACPNQGISQSASLFSLQCQMSSDIYSGYPVSGRQVVQQTSVSDLCQSKAPLVERLIILLVKSGARVDFRNADGKTPLHVAAIRSNFWALKTLLDVGAPTNYRDVNGLTPLYYSILHRANLKVTQSLLSHNLQQQQQQYRSLGMSNVGHDNFKGLGILDQHGWQEVHQACKLGLDGHLDKLLQYGCDMDAKISGSGNTPLHVAAINDQLDCAKVLLMRGASKSITNNSHQTAHQVAVIAGNMGIAEFIAEHDESKVIPFNDRPYNNNISPNALVGQQPHQLFSRGSARSSMANSQSQHSNITIIAISPSSTLSGTYGNGNGNNSNYNNNSVNPSPRSNYSNENSSNRSTTTDYEQQYYQQRQYQQQQQNQPQHDDPDEEDLTSSASSGGGYGGSNDLDSLMPDERLAAGTLVRVCSDFQSGDSQHLQLHRGDIIEVLDYDQELPKLANKPMLFGRRKTDGSSGLFPSFCVSRSRLVATASMISTASRSVGRPAKPEPPKRDPTTTLTRHRAQKAKSILIQQQQVNPIGQDRAVAATSDDYSTSTATNARFSNTTTSTCMTNGTTSATTSETAISSTKTLPLAQSQLPPPPPPLPDFTSQADLSPPVAAVTGAQNVQSYLPPPPPPLPVESPPEIKPATAASKTPAKLQRRMSSAVDQHNGSMVIDSKSLLERRQSLAVVSQTAEQQHNQLPLNGLDATSSSTTQIGSVAAACAALANSRMQRQQQQQQQQQQQHQQVSGQVEDDEQHAKESTGHEQAGQLMQQQQVDQSSDPNLKSDEMNQQLTPPQLPPKASQSPPKTGSPSSHEQAPLPPPSLPPPPPESSALQTQHNHPHPHHNHQAHPNHQPQSMRQQQHLNHQQMSATLGRRSSAQVIQEPKNNHSQTLRVSKPNHRRPSIPNYDELPPPPPALPPAPESHHPPPPRTLSKQHVQTKEFAIYQQNPHAHSQNHQHQHHTHQHEHVQTSQQQQIYQAEAQRRHLQDLNHQHPIHLQQQLVRERLIQQQLLMQQQKQLQVAEQNRQHLVRQQLLQKQLLLQHQQQQQQQQHHHHQQQQQLHHHQHSHQHQLQQSNHHVPAQQPVYHPSLKHNNVIDHHHHHRCPWGYHH